MQILPQAILELLVLVVPQVHGDARGFFVETARQSVLQEAGITSWCSRKESWCAAPVARCLMWPRMCSGAPPRLTNRIGVLLNDVTHHQL